MATADTLASSKNRADPAGTPRIEWVSIGVLRPNPRNARTHSRKQIKLIAASIKEFGFLNPVIVDDANMILAGHGRLEAAKLEGLTHAPIVRFGHLTAAQKRAYVIADNKLAEQAGWDREILAIELGELIDLLPAEGFDVSLTGFEAPEIDLLLADMAPLEAATRRYRASFAPDSSNATRGFVAAGKTPALVRRCTASRRLRPPYGGRIGVGGVLRSAIQPAGERDRRARACSASRIYFRLRRNGPGAISKVPP